MASAGNFIKIFYKERLARSSANISIRKEEVRGSNMCEREIIFVY